MTDKSSFKRICEQTWHHEVLLKEFEECPICHSSSYHLLTIEDNSQRIKDRNLTIPKVSQPSRAEGSADTYDKKLPLGIANPHIGGIVESLPKEKEE